MEIRLVFIKLAAILYDNLASVQLKFLHENWLSETFRQFNFIWTHFCNRGMTSEIISGMTSIKLWKYTNDIYLCQIETQQYEFIIIHLFSYNLVWGHLWRNCYRRMKCIQLHKFKYWTRLCAFQIAPIPLWKVWIQLFFLPLWIINWANWVL